MTTTILLAYFLVATYFVTERLQRKGEQALSLQAGLADGGSSRLLRVGMLIGIVSLSLAPVFNSNNLARLYPFTKSASTEVGRGAAISHHLQRYFPKLRA